MTLAPPDLPGLAPRRLAEAVSNGVLTLDGALVEPDDSETVSAHQIKISESELRGVTTAALATALGIAIESN